MKHAAVLYTCVGLMGAAALAGFIDYSDASRSGVMSSLYQEETQSTGSTLVSKKPVDLDDYSRGPIEEYTAPEEIVAVNADDPKKKRKSKKLIPPPPPPAPDAPPVPVIKEGNIPPPPPPEPEVPPVPVTEPAPPVEPVIETPAIPVVETVPPAEVKEVSFKSFSRAPLKKKSAPVAKRKQ
jgi:hypothetical protein